MALLPMPAVSPGPSASTLVILPCAMVTVTVTGPPKPWAVAVALPDTSRAVPGLLQAAIPQTIAPSNNTPRKQYNPFFPIIFLIPLFLLKNLSLYGIRYGLIL
jgi:hypothetical protein